MKEKFNSGLLIFLGLLILNQSSFLSADNCQRCASSECQTDSKTFFRPRSIIEEVVFFLGLNQYNFYRRYLGPDNCFNDERVHIAVGGLFEKSNSHAKNNVGNFFFAGKPDLTEEISDNAVESIITVRPERQVAGCYFDYHQDFCFCDGLWLDVRLALYQAVHNLNAKECGLSEVAESDCTPLNFLSSSELKFGRIPTAESKRTGFDDIEVKLGYFFKHNESGYLGIYASTLLPTARKPTGKFLFEPLVGRGHFALGGGFNMACNIYRSEITTLTLLTDFSYQYLFNRNELRSLDFFAGQLTRFVIANDISDSGIPVPSINVTTFNLKVAPRGVINFWLASHLQRCKWHAEFGYNLWWRQSEKICFPACLTPNFNNLGISEGNIFIPITLDNLDLASTSHPRVLTNKIYLALSRDTELRCRPINIGLGGSYEFSRNINSFEQWGIWLNIVIGF